MVERKFDGSAQELDKQEPTIVSPKEKVLLMGIKHGIDFRDTGWNGNIIRQIVPQAEHLLLEGKRYEHATALSSALQGEAPLDLESYAFNDFLGRFKSNDIHCLEDDFDMFAVGEAYGISLPIHIAAVTAGAIPPNEDEEDMYVSTMADFLKKGSPRLEGLAPGELESMQRVAIQGQRSIMQYPDLMTEFMVGRITIIRYMGGVRDYEVITPRAKELTKTLPGQKAILLGAEHVSNIEKVIRGETLVQPASFFKHINELGPDDEIGVSVFQDVAQGWYS